MFAPALPKESAEQQQYAAFNNAFNSKFSEQFNKDYIIQQDILTNNPKFLRTRQSLEAERQNPIGVITDMTPYPLYQENTLKPDQFRKHATQGQLECNLLNQVFFSQENVDLVQEQLRYRVWLASNKKHIITRQSDIELQLIMRSIYFQYAKNLPFHIKEQIEDLNELVITECISKVLSQIEQHIGYLFDASTQPIPLSLPESMSSTGRKQLPSVTSTFFN